MPNLTRSGRSRDSFSCRPSAGMTSAAPANRRGSAEEAMGFAMLPVRIQGRGYDWLAMNPSRRSLALGLALAALTASACNLPDLTQEQANAPALPQTSFVFASDGSMITPMHAEQNRVIVPLSKIPENIRNAVVAIEDKRYYDHLGIDRGGRLDHHAAVHQERLHRRRADAVAEDPGGRAGPSTGTDAQQGRDPGEVPQHRVLR